MDRRKDFLAVFLGTLIIILVSLVAFILLRNRGGTLPAELSSTGIPTNQGGILPTEPSPREVPTIGTTPTQIPTQAPEQLLETRYRFESESGYLLLEFLDDDLVHFELSDTTDGPDVNQPIYTTPMIAKTDYPGPSSLTGDGLTQFETPDLEIQIDPDTLCITATDKVHEPDLKLTQICASSAPRGAKRISLTQESVTDIYGLGQKFIEAGEADGNWMGGLRLPGDYGNVMEPFQGGMVGNTQFPVAYFAGNGSESYAIFLDNPYQQFWNFQNDPWIITMGGDAVRFYLLSGAGLPDLRSDYLELTGRPPVPPKKMFGLWISEYGFDSWNELEDKLRTLRSNHFPVDGFVLDLPWYGGITAGSDDTRMGSLDWNEADFPNPEDKIADLLEREGLGIMTIEQPYVGGDLPEHSEMEELGYLVRSCETCEPVYLNSNPWWGSGGMLDFTHEAGAAFWHDWKREPLIEAGVMAHWTDLGEPEAFDPNGWYEGLPVDEVAQNEHEDIHNLYNFFWNQSIYDGYLRNGHEQRPFILTRSGAPGIQRFGSAMWSGDIGGNLESLTAHFNAQMQMSMSGMDYYGADIGGFYRPDAYLDEVYTQWFANGMAFDVPARPHTFNVENEFETAPDRIGYVESNLANTRQRYELIPYLYSLAHRAYLFGEPVFPPLVYYYPDDLEVRDLANEKMIGSEILVATVSAKATYIRSVYLPAGDWINYHTNEWFHSKGERMNAIPVNVEDVFRLPTFVRAGAILPQMYVDEQTMNVMGKRLDGSSRDELIVQVYASPTENSFTLYEDDGETTAYQDGEVRTTLITQKQEGKSVRVEIETAMGNYAGAVDRRNNMVKLVTDRMGTPLQVSLNGESLQKYESQAEFESAGSGWYLSERGEVIAKSGEMAVGESKVFQFEYP